MIRARTFDSWLQVSAWFSLDAKVPIISHLMVAFHIVEDKNERKEVHDFIKMFYSQYNSNTTSEGGIQQIEINHCRSNVIHLSKPNKSSRSLF